LNFLKISDNDGRRGAKDVAKWRDWSFSSLLLARVFDLPHR
jgi:hypothetical protein